MLSRNVAFFELRPVQGGFISKSLREINADQLRMTEIRSRQVHPMEFDPGKSSGCEVSLNEAGTGQIRSSQCDSLKIDPLQGHTDQPAASETCEAEIAACPFRRSSIVEPSLVRAQQLFHGWRRWAGAFVGSITTSHGRGGVGFISSLSTVRPRFREISGDLPYR